MERSGWKRVRQRQRGRGPGSVLPLRHAALHLQHLGPPLEFIGICAVFYMLGKRKKTPVIYLFIHLKKVTYPTNIL